MTVRSRLRWWFAWLMAGLVRLVVRPRVWSRWTAWDPVACTACGWAGPLRWASLGYEDDGSGEDVVACDSCPKCGCPELDYSF